MTENNFRLQSLLSECKWEYKKIGDIVIEISAGGLPKERMQRKGWEPVIKVGDISGLKTPYIRECKIFLDGSMIKNKIIARKGDILMIHNSGSNSLVGKLCLYVGEIDCIVGNNMYVIKHNQNPRYLFHLLNSEQVQRQIKIDIEKKKVHGSRGWIKSEDLKNIQILIPSLETQEKIANYLDDLLLNNIKLENDLERMI